MTSVHPPVVSYPLPRLPVPIEPAPELLSLARQSPVNLSLLTLLAHPAQRARLQAGPALLPGAVEELIRYVQLSSALPPARVTTEEVTFGGVTIPAGGMVFTLFVIANRDPAAFPDPDTFDITRQLGTHLGFGVGAHHCLGAQLARAELTEAFRGLLGRLSGARLAVGADQLRFKENMTITSLMELPVTWGAGDGTGQ